MERLDQGAADQLAVSEFVATQVEPERGQRPLEARILEALAGCWTGDLHQPLGSVGYQAVAGRRRLEAESLVTGPLLHRWLPLEPLRRHSTSDDGYLVEELTRDAEDRELPYARNRGPQRRATRLGAEAHGRHRSHSRDRDRYRDSHPLVRTPSSSISRTAKAARCTLSTPL